MDDRELMGLLERDPESGVRQLMQQYAALVYSIVSGRAGSAAGLEDIEECVSDIFFEIYRKRHSFDPEKGTLRTFISVVARNRAVSLFRKAVREGGRRADGEPPEGVEPGFEEAVIGAEERHQLLKTIHSLGEPDSQIIFRRYYFGQKSKEIAADLGMTPGAVDTRLSRALGKLRSMLGGKNDAKDVDKCI